MSVRGPEGWWGLALEEAMSVRGPEGWWGMALEEAMSVRGPEGWWGMALERRAMLGVKEQKLGGFSEMGFLVRCIG
jgi:hypothetical protein